MSAPVFDHAGRITATISVLGSTRSLNLDWNGQVAQRLRRAAREMSKALGYVEGAN
jgi:DNA-binding IclR family transcriptional regulator